VTWANRGGADEKYVEEHPTYDVDTNNCGSYAAALVESLGLTFAARVTGSV
jgi:hypothetical protein